MLKLLQLAIAIRHIFISRNFFCFLATFCIVDGFSFGFYNRGKRGNTYEKAKALPWDLDADSDRKSWPLREFCVSDFRQNQEYHVINVQDGGLFPLVAPVPEGGDGMRAVCGVNAVSAFREVYFKGISLPCGRRT